MNVIELNVKDYIKRQTLNIAFEGNNKTFFVCTERTANDNYVIFDDVYKLYNDFKKLGKNLFLEQDNIINKIEVHDDKILFKWPLITKTILTEREDKHLTNFLTSKYSFNNDDIGLNLVSQNDILNFSVLIYLCSDSIKSFVRGLNSYDESEIQTAEKKFNRIIAITENKVVESFHSSNLQIIPEIIAHIESTKQSLSQIVEELLFNEEFETIVPWLKYTDILAIFFHFFKLEIVYYSHTIENEIKKPRLCPICNKYVIGKCKCMTVSASYRRNQNKKCARLRNKLEMYLDNYSCFIPIEYRMKAERMLEAADDGIKHWQDLPELRRLCYGIEAELKETKQY